MVRHKGVSEVINRSGYITYNSTCTKLLVNHAQINMITNRGTSIFGYKVNVVDIQWFLNYENKHFSREIMRKVFS